MSIVTVTKNTYTVESLYQWDKDQVLKIRGLSLPAVPEIHFTNAAMDKAIVRQASMDAAGVITADIPNSLLQKPYKVKAYVCIYSGSTFETLYKVEIPVVARAMPADYTLEDDQEVYSFNALENKVENALVAMNATAAAAEAAMRETTAAATEKLNAATLQAETAKKDYEAARDTIQVTGFNGRTGAVVPQAGDYTAAMVGAVDISTQKVGTFKVTSGLSSDTATVGYYTKIGKLYIGFYQTKYTYQNERTQTIQTTIPCDHLTAIITPFWTENYTAPSTSIRSITPGTNGAMSYYVYQPNTSHWYQLTFLFYGWDD